MAMRPFQPKWRRLQRVEKDPYTIKKMIKKIAKVCRRKYISPGHVWTLTDFFSVPKGSRDILMVYNGTSPGLNDVLWLPSFPLPIMETLLRLVHPGTWMADTDQELAGVDVTHY
jgi:hypothetical protein